MADHLLNFIVLGRTSTPQHHRFVHSRNFRKLNETKFIEDLRQTPWHIIECFEDIEDAWHTWKCLFAEILNQHAPMRKFRAPKKSKQPWYDEQIEALKNLRDHYHRRATTGNLPDDWQNYRKARNRVTTMVRQKKKEYFTSTIENNKGD